MAMKLTPQQQQQAEVKQFREFLLSYNRLSEMCFVDCVMDFTSRKVTDGESLIQYLSKYGITFQVLTSPLLTVGFAGPVMSALFDSAQENCASNCMEKYLKMTQRISQRFQEYQVQQNENILAAQKGFVGR